MKPYTVKKAQVGWAVVGPKNHRAVYPYKDAAELQARFLNAAYRAGWEAADARVRP